MAYTVDLHNHTPLIPTDYAEAGARPSDLVDAALAAGIDVLGVTDHTSVAYFRRIEKAAAGTALLVVPGVELKVRRRDGEAHLIALLRPETYERDFDAIRESLGVERDLPPARLATVTIEADPCEVARVVVSRGGICHVAHVDRYFGRYRLLGTPMLDAMAEAPLSAVELVDATNAARLPEWASALPVIRSSDAHSPSELGRRTTTLALDELSFEGLRRGLAAAAAIAS